MVHTGNTFEKMTCVTSHDITCMSVISREMKVYVVR